MSDRHLDPIHAHVFFLAKPGLAAEIDSAFTDLDLTDLTRQVLDDTDPNNRMAVTRALDDWFGTYTNEQDPQEDGDDA